MVVRFSRSARRHRIGKAHALFVMEQSEPRVVPADDSEDERWLWVGVDDRGLELEIVAIALPETLLVIHVMPAHYRR